jgi:SAM-dependent methyltransferase
MSEPAGGRRPGSAASRSGPDAVDPGMRQKTLERFHGLRRAWAANAALRLLYERWYGRVRAALPALQAGPWIEIGSGPGFARDFIPEMMLTDLVQADWHERAVSADDLPFEAASIGALVLFDVLHHLPSPAAFFAEAARVLRPGGRVVLCEPYISPVSYPVYRYLHVESADMKADPMAERVSIGKDPFESNQAIPTLIFRAPSGRIEASFPGLRVVSVERFAGPCYPLSGGFSRAPLLPLGAWRALLAVEDLLPASAFKLLGFRMLAIVERS